MCGLVAIPNVVVGVGVGWRRYANRLPLPWKALLARARAKPDIKPIVVAFTLPPSLPYVALSLAPLARCICRHVGVVASVAWALLPLLCWYHCQWRFGIIAVAVLALALSLLLLRRCPIVAPTLLPSLHCCCRPCCTSGIAGQSLCPSCSLSCGLTRKPTTKFYSERLSALHGENELKSKEKLKG